MTVCLSNYTVFLLRNCCAGGPHISVDQHVEWFQSPGSTGAAEHRHSTETVTGSRGTLHEYQQSAGCPRARRSAIVEGGCTTQEDWRNRDRISARRALSKDVSNGGPVCRGGRCMVGHALFMRSVSASSSYGRHLHRVLISPIAESQEACVNRAISSPERRSELQTVSLHLPRQVTLVELALIRLSLVGSKPPRLF
jgi:hypothetical protein